MKRWMLRIMFECPHCGKVQGQDGSVFYHLPRDRELHNMKCNKCHHVSVYPFSVHSPIKEVNSD
jgi:transcription elongation factor Elf1